MGTYRRIVTIAGSDSGGGAGIQADLKTFSALGCYGMSVVTAITAQNTVGVQHVMPIPAEVVGLQLDAVLKDIGVDGLKIGMVHSIEIMKTISEQITQFEGKAIVVDPVMVSTSGDSLMKQDGLDYLKEVLLPKATVITPNLPEASVLLGQDVKEQAHMKEACVELANCIGRSVLLKGGHLNDQLCSDVLYDFETQKLHDFKSDRINTQNTHGTGCTLASALTVFLVKGYPIDEAVTKAKEYLYKALLAGASYKIGHGHGPVHHFYSIW